MGKLQHSCVDNCEYWRPDVPLTPTSESKTRWCSIGVLKKHPEIITKRLDCISWKEKKEKSMLASEQ